MPHAKRSHECRSGARNAPSVRLHTVCGAQKRYKACWQSRFALRLRTKLKIGKTGVVLVGLSAVLAAGVYAFAHFDWNHAKPWVNERMSAALGRPFAVGGDLSVEWHRRTDPEAGWRGWIPWPELAANDVRIGNPAGFPVPAEMAVVGRVTFSMNPLPLLAKKIIVPTLVLDASQLSLQRTSDGKNNWGFDETGPTAWTFEFETLVLSKATVHLTDAIRHADVLMNVDTLPGNDPAGYGIAWKLAGSFNKEAVRGSGRAGGVLSLRAQAAPYPIDAEVHVGKTAIKATGTLTKPSDLAALEMRLKLSGASMAQLFPIIGVPLPETPAYVTDGHLTGVFGKSGNDWTYEKFTGKVGTSDLAGTLKYESRKPRSNLKGEVVSKLLNFSDLAPVIGADSKSGKAARGVPDNQPAGKVLPVESFKTDRWRQVDVDVKFAGRRILRDKALPIDNLTTRIRVDDGVLSLAPLDFGVAGGTLKSTVRLDGRAAAVKATLAASARALNLKQLFPTVSGMQTSLGVVNGDVSLNATGNSVALLLASSYGDVRAVMLHGTISKLLLDEIGLNVGSVVLGKIFGDKTVRINCAVGDFSVGSGVMRTRTVVVDTEQSTLQVEGQVDFGRELLDLKLKPQNKSVRTITFSGPLYVTGSFAAPKVDVDRGMIALKAAGAAALAAFAPIAALLPLTSFGQEQDNDCRRLIEASKARPARPPG